MTSMFLALSLPVITAVGLWAVFNTDKIDAWILRDLEPCRQTNKRLACIGHALVGEER